MSDKALLQRFDDWRRDGRSLVLATVVSTSGSTYTKPGHRILIADSGDYQGLVSGGCLEGDLALHAQHVIASGKPQVITYDLRGDGDDPFGLGIGCDGLLRVLLQPLSPDSGFEPMASIAEVLRGEVTTRCSVLLGDYGGLRTGMTMIGVGVRSDRPDLAAADVLDMEIRPIPRLLVLGAGPDAVPVVILADALGWRVTLVDHRPAYLDQPGFASAELRLCAPAAEFTGQVALRIFDAAIIMSHHLATDRSYLRALAASPVPYIGLLGPAGRRDRLLRELGDGAGTLRDRLHGPAGLDIGANSPETIALAILAEIHGTTRFR